MKKSCAFWFISLALLLGFLPFQPAVADSVLAWDSAYATALIPGQEVSAGYLTLSNPGSEDQIITSFSSAAAGAVQLHQTAMRNGIMSMDMVSELVIPAGKSVELQPGGMHLMIMGVDKQAFASGSIDLDLHLASGELLSIAFPVKSMQSPH